ncbi:MAG: coproporphyrinogen III oxidase [Chloroflexi bacterium]|nr:coproporphyrinogen III oxidase [Chloroflexota bacterium]
MDKSIALYIHIPFCETKCPYCDFNTYSGIESVMPGYVKALNLEITKWADWLDHPKLSSVFWGGGTPSYLPTRDVKQLMRTIDESFDVDSSIEQTIEANPGDCSRDRLQTMRKSGFNRISIGVQSFDDNELLLLGRRHNSDQAITAVENSRDAGFDNISIDLMFGLPNQYFSTWAETLNTAINLDIEHTSAYALTLEKGTPLENDVRKGKLPEPDPDLAAEMYSHAQSLFISNQMNQYEISNWSRPCKESSHNLAYWKCMPYLGLGPGAHSYLYGSEQIDEFGIRFANLNSPKTYINRIHEWKLSNKISYASIRNAAAVDLCEKLDAPTAMSDTMMMGLRLNEGVSDLDFEKRFGINIPDAYPNATTECLELGLVEWHNTYLQLTEYGRILGNEAFMRFVGETPKTLK